MEKLYPESVVKELIRQTIEMTMQQLNISAIAHVLYPDHKGKFEVTGLKSPALEGWIELPLEALTCIRSNFELWQKSEIKDGAFSFHLHNNLLRIEKSLTLNEEQK